MGTDNRYQQVLNTVLAELQTVSEFADRGSLPIKTFAGGSTAEQTIEFIQELAKRELPLIHVGVGPQGTEEEPAVVQQDQWTCQATVIIMLARSGERITRLFGTRPDQQLPAIAQQNNNLLMLSYLSRIEEVMAIMPLHNSIDWGFAEGRPIIARLSGDFVPIDRNPGTAAFVDFLLSFAVPYRRGVNYDYPTVSEGDFDSDFDGDYD